MQRPMYGVDMVSHGLQVLRLVLESEVYLQCSIALVLFPLLAYFIGNQH